MFAPRLPSLPPTLSAAFTHALYSYEKASSVSMFVFPSLYCRSTRAHSLALSLSLALSFSFSVSLVLSRALSLSFSVTPLCLSLSFSLSLAPLSLSLSLVLFYLLSSLFLRFSTLRAACCACDVCAMRGREDDNNPGLCAGAV